MLLQRLCDYADRQLSLPPPNYLEQPIRYIIDLDEQGGFAGFNDTKDASIAAQKRGRRREAPALVRTSGVRAKLLADKASYALGIGDAAEPTPRDRDEHAAFIALTESCATRTGDPDVAAVLTFLRSEDARQVLVLPPDFDPGENVTFRVAGRFPIDAVEVQAFWVGLQSKGNEPTMPCVICGEVRPVLGGHPVTIKPIPGGQTSGNFMVSANAKAFESYGLERSLIAPTCASCAEKYAKALNALLADDLSRLRMDEIVFVFWTVEPVSQNFVRFFKEPRKSEVQELFNAPVSGRAEAIDIDDVAFYAVGLSGSGARVAVRSWLDTTVGEAKRQLIRYFALQDIEDAQGAPGEPLSLRALAGATVRDPRKDAPHAGVADAVIGLALRGERLPEDVLFRAVLRCRAGQGVNHARAALIKMALGSQQQWTMERIKAMAGLDTANREPAYLCGRILAVVDLIQQRAIDPNATVVDKFYGSASSAPASVFGNLLGNARNHLSKLDKNPRTSSAAHALDTRLEEIMDGLPEFPKTLTLQEQAMFALGFYHQRAAERRQRRERAEENQRKREQDADAAEDDL